jgi:hypothetical protein
MKKTIPILAAIGVLACTGVAFAQEVVFVKPLTEPSAKKKLEQKEPKIDEGSRTGGVIPRAIRSGNPLQLINPFAPAKYGNGSNMTSSTTGQGSASSRVPPGDPGTSETFKIFSWEF